MNSQDAVQQISVIELKKALDAGKVPVLLDVREPHELEICKLDYTLHIPISTFRLRLDELEKYKNTEIIVYCRSGHRSNMAAAFLLESRFNSVKNLKGGILAWADEIDSSFQKY